MTKRHCISFPWVGLRSRTNPTYQDYSRPKRRRRWPMLSRNWMMAIALILIGSNQVQNQLHAQIKGEKNMELKSSVFEAGGMIPKQYTCEGQDISPPLSWNTVPEKTQSLALICDDPDAPMGVWVHWVIFNLPADTRELAENVPPQKTLANGAKQGTND